MTARLPCLALAAAALLLVACGDERPAPAASGAAPSAFLRTSDVPEAKNVYAARKRAPGDEVAVFGRVRDVTAGYAAFTMIDASLEYCGQVTDEKCPTPWDYCCTAPETIAEASIPVEFRDAQGQPVETSDPQLRNLDLVAVMGKIEKSESGGLVVVTTTGWFRRERPKLGDHVNWP